MKIQPSLPPLRALYPDIRPNCRLISLLLYQYNSTTPANRSLQKPLDW